MYIAAQQDQSIENQAGVRVDMSCRFCSHPQLSASQKMVETKAPRGNRAHFKDRGCDKSPTLRAQ